MKSESNPRFDLGSRRLHSIAVTGFFLGLVLNLEVSERNDDWIVLGLKREARMTDQ